MPIIRDATEADLPAILEITNEAILNTTAIWDLSPTTLAERTEWMRGRIGRGFPVLAAERDGAVAGFASYGDFRPREGFRGSVEHSVYVAPKAQGEGIGKGLLMALLDRGARGGVHVMIGAIEGGNTASIALHEKAGFVKAGVLPQVGQKFGRWLDLLYMCKVLS